MISEDRTDRSLILSWPAAKESNIMNTEKGNFDKEAASWDERPGRVKLAKDIAHAISKQIVLSPKMDVMDLGF